MFTVWKSVCKKCSVCNNKTRTKIREDTRLINFPLYCPKCKHESIINASLLSSNGAYDIKKD